MSDHDRFWTDSTFETRAIHAGQAPDPTTGAVTIPIYQTSTFVQPAVGQEGEYEYARSANPTRTALQDVVASLEGGAWGLAYASGLAAEQNIAYLLGPGDHAVISDDVYGGTYRLFARVLARYGIEFTQVDVRDLDEVRAAIRPTTRMVWVESPSNPYLKIADLAGIAEIIRNHPARLVVDNTFASPYLQQPLSLGADLVVHSTTKYLGGHSDVVGGLVAGNDAELFETLKFHQNAGGAVPGPMDCWLALRGIKTLAVRMDRHCANAQRVAEFLQEQDAVEQVFYPGLPGHPGHDIAARQMRGFSGMVSFTVRGGYEAAQAVAGATEVFALAVSLGGVESLIEHPASMTHAAVTGTKGEVAPNLLRLSVGIEGVDDIIGDLQHALVHAAVGAAR